MARAPYIRCYEGTKPLGPVVRSIQTYIANIPNNQYGFPARRPGLCAAPLGTFNRDGRLSHASVLSEYVGDTRVFTERNWRYFCYDGDGSDIVVDEERAWHREMALDTDHLHHIFHWYSLTAPALQAQAVMELPSSAQARDQPAMSYGAPAPATAQQQQQQQPQQVQNAGAVWANQLIAQPATSPSAGQPRQQQAQPAILQHPRVAGLSGRPRQPRLPGAPSADPQPAHQPVVQSPPARVERKPTPGLDAAYKRLTEKREKYSVKPDRLELFKSTLAVILFRKGRPYEPFEVDKVDGRSKVRGRMSKRGWTRLVEAVNSRLKKGVENFGPVESQTALWDVEKEGWIEINAFKDIIAKEE